jgi:hypothetical protein
MHALYTPRNTTVPLHKQLSSSKTNLPPSFVCLLALAALPDTKQSSRMSSGAGAPCDRELAGTAQTAVEGGEYDKAVSTLEALGAERAADAKVRPHAALRCTLMLLLWLLPVSMATLKTCPA